MIIREDIFPDKAGKIIKFLRKIPILKDDAYLRIFHGWPSYLSENKVNEREWRRKSLGKEKVER